jgi:hypothetical protein
MFTKDKHSNFSIEDGQNLKWPISNNPKQIFILEKLEN